MASRGKRAKEWLIESFYWLLFEPFNQSWFVVLEKFSPSTVKFKEGTQKSGLV